MMPQDPAETDFQAGALLLIDKPKGWTSFDVVNKVRNALRVKKVGHAGTLDPLATGLLILCTGKMTKQLADLQGLDKCYEVEFKLGATTASYDAEQPEEAHCGISHITREAIETAMQQWTGDIDQMPPIFSAIKVGGKKAYQAARKGQDIQLSPRQVKILAFDQLTELNAAGGLYSARVHCSKGTYIRSLVHDLGQTLGVGAYIRDLRRTAVGDLSITEAWALPAFLEALPPAPPKVSQ